MASNRCFYKDTLHKCTLWVTARDGSVETPLIYRFQKSSVRHCADWPQTDVLQHDSASCVSSLRPTPWRTGRNPCSGHTERRLRKDDASLRVVPPNSHWTWKIPALPKSSNALLDAAIALEAVRLLGLERFGSRIGPGTRPRASPLPANDDSMGTNRPSVSYQAQRISLLRIRSVIVCHPGHAASSTPFRWRCKG